MSHDGMENMEARKPAGEGENEVSSLAAAVVN